MSRLVVEETRDYGLAMSFTLFMSMEQLGQHHPAHDIRLCREWWHRMLAVAAIDALRASEGG